MQSIGVYFNSLVISVEYLFRGDDLSWRVAFVIGALLLGIVFQLRIFRYLGDFEEESKQARTAGSQLFLGHTVALVAMGGAFTSAWLVGQDEVGVKRLQVYGSAVVGAFFLCLSCFELGSGSPASKVVFFVVSCLGQFVIVSIFVISAVSFDEDS